MKINRERRRSQRRGKRVTCPLEYRGLEGCGHELEIVRMTADGLVECSNCGLWFAPEDVADLRAA